MSLEDKDASTIGTEPTLNYAEVILELAITREQLASAIAERDALSKQVAHFESSPFHHRNLFESDGDLGHKDYSTITKEQFDELFEYSEECNCQSCAEIRYMLRLRAERDKAVELLREVRTALACFNGNPPTALLGICHKLDTSSLLEAQKQAR